MRQSRVSIQLPILLLSCLLAFSMTACGGSEEQTSEDTASETTPSESNPSENAGTDQAGGDGKALSELPTVTAEECGPKLEQLIQYYNRLGDMIDTHGVRNLEQQPGYTMLQAKIDSVSKEVDDNGRMFYNENYSRECWEKYTAAAMKVSQATMKAVNEEMPKIMDEMQKGLDEAAKNMEEAQGQLAP